MENQSNKQKFYNTMWFLWLMIILAPYIGIFFLIIKKPFSKKVNSVLIAYCVIMSLFIIGSSMVEPDTDVVSDKTLAQEAVQASDSNQSKAVAEKEAADQKLKEQLTFTGKMSLTAEKGKAVVTIDTNVPDGGIFEVAVVNADFKVVSDYIPVKGGKIIKEFTIPKDWKIGYISSMAMFRFNLKDHPQPDSIKAIYGDNGEKMLGSQAVDHTSGGKNGNIEVAMVAYPDEAAVKEAQSKLFNETLAKIIDTSNGVIVSVEPRFESGDWSAILVTVSDSWYVSQEYEKERFAEQVQQLLETLVKNVGYVKKESSVSVFYYDTYGKELASPKMLGGYKILR